MNYINFEQIYQHFNLNQFYFDKIDFIDNIFSYNVESIEFKEQENIIVENNNINKPDICSICLEEFKNGEMLIQLTECKVFYINK